MFPSQMGAVASSTSHVIPLWLTNHLEPILGPNKALRDQKKVQKWPKIAQKWTVFCKMSLKQHFSHLTVANDLFYCWSHMVEVKDGLGTPFGAIWGLNEA